ncbi:hypothetical protein HanRHA438_Chr09g0397441 [Helianthus annuus]|nr:hypothetical protein HanRHA438_Chr09g0397441 [Helianthus annuus]
MSFFRFFFPLRFTQLGFFHCVLRNWIFKKKIRKYSNSILVLKIKKRSFSWCNFYKKNNVV